MSNATLNRRQFITAALGITGALGLAACGSSATAGNSGATSSSAGSSPASTSSFDGNFVLGFDQDFPPYGYVGDDGSYTGFDIDLAQAVCDREGWKLVPTPISWDAKDTLLNSGQITCIWNGFTIEGREDNYTFSEPYMLNEQVIVVKKDSGITSLSDLAGKTVVTQADSAALDVLEGDKKDVADTFKSLQTLPDYNNAFMQLESGMVDAVACDLSIAQYQIAAKPDAYQQLDPLSSEHYAVGFKKGDDALAAKVTSTLKDMYNDGTVEKLIEKYADYGMSAENWVLK